MPDHDEHLPEPIAAYVPQAGRQLQRRLFQLLIEKADQDLVFPRRHGQAGQGIQRRGTRPSTFKTTLGEVTGARSRISHQYEGAREIPWATAGNTPHRLAITQNLGDPVGDPMLDRSARQSRADIGQRGGAEDVLGRRTIVAIGPQEGEQLITAQRPRARALLDDVPEDPWAGLGVSAEDTWVELPDDVPPGDDPEAADAAWEQVPGEWAARGFPGCEPAFPGPAGQPRDVDPGDVMGQPDEVKTQAQPAPGRKEVWTFPAVVLVAGLQDALAASTAETLGFPVAALLVPWGVLSGARRLLVLGDGAAWIRPWFESWGVGPQALIVCWWHLRKRCSEQLRAAGGPQDRRRALERDRRGQLWEGKVDAAVDLLRGAWEGVRDPQAVPDLIEDLAQRRASLPASQERKRWGLGIASTRVEPFHAWAVSGRCKPQGMSWSPQGVLALAALEATRRHGELDRWPQDRELPARELPEAMRKVA